MAKPTKRNNQTHHIKHLLLHAAIGLALLIVINLVEGIYRFEELERLSAQVLISTKKLSSPLVENSPVQVLNISLLRNGDG